MVNSASEIERPISIRFSNSTSKRWRETIRLYVTEFEFEFELLPLFESNVHKHIKNIEIEER